MQKRTILTAGAALLALAACSRRDETAPAANGVISSAGLQVNAIGAATSCLSPADMNRPVQEFSQDQRRELVGCMNTATARQINAQLPRQLDEYTRLDRLSTEGPLMTYHYTVLRTPPGAGGDLGARLEASTRGLTCANPQARQTLEFGGSYAFRWVDNQGALIHEMRIDNC
jgi:hypothetical protein